MQVLALKELHEGAIDHNLYVLFDSMEHQYYVFGTRRVLNKATSDFTNYEYVYSDVRLLVAFIGFLSDNFKSKFIVELYKMDTIPDEYIDEVDFDYVHSRIAPRNLLAAYDNVVLTKKYLTSIAGFLC